MTTHTTAQTDRDAYIDSFEGIPADAFDAKPSSHYNEWSRGQKNALLKLLWAIPAAAIAVAAFAGFVLPTV
jgi:uncharacterized membrane protein